MSEKVEHTPLPWSVSSLVPADGLYVLDGNYDFVAATAEWADDGTLIQAFGGIEKAIKNSEYIVLACNSYPALLAERDRLREAVEEATRHIERTLESSMPLKGVDGAGVPYADRLQYARDFVEHAHALIKDTNQ